MSRLGIRHHLITAYHPQANGMIERAHHQLKDALRARLASDNWLAHLPYVLLSLRATPKEDANISSAELVYGAPILLPGQLQQVPEPLPAVFNTADRLNPTWIPTRPLPTSSTLQHLPSDLAQARYVYVRQSGAARLLTPAYSGPFLVFERSPKFFTIDLGDSGPHQTPPGQLSSPSRHRTKKRETSCFSGQSSGLATWGGVV